MITYALALMGLVALIAISGVAFAALLGSPLDDFYDPEPDDEPRSLCPWRRP